MKAYITKYALTEGIVVRDGEVVGATSELLTWKSEKGWNQFAYGKEWHETPNIALADAEARRVRKIASLKKQLARLEKLTFTIPEE